MLVATPASLQAGTELILHKGTRYLQPNEVLGITKREEARLPGVARDCVVKTGSAATLFVTWGLGDIVHVQDA